MDLLVKIKKNKKSFPATLNKLLTFHKEHGIFAKNMIKIAYSILSADFANLSFELKKVEKAGVDAIHIDIMDGHFVPNLSMGPKVVAAIKRNTHLFLDVHLMIYNPFNYVEAFVAAGADLITFHVEATEDVLDTINFVKRCGKKAGLAFNPETSLFIGEKYLSECDLLLFMSVNPGFSGQKFQKEVVNKIALAKDLLKDRKYSNIEIQVDGGIDVKSAKLCVDAGANFLVSGNYLSTCGDMTEGVKRLKGMH
jgi:ribulose-phosphate 3-epimerase